MVFSNRMKNNLQKLREARDISRARLAEEAETSVQQVERLENGKRRLSDHWIERFVKAFHRLGHKEITPSMFFEGGLAEMDEEFIEIMRKIEDPQLKAELQALALKRLLEK